MVKVYVFLFLPWKSIVWAWSLQNFCSSSICLSWSSWCHRAELLLHSFSSTSLWLSVDSRCLGWWSWSIAPPAGCHSPFVSGSPTWLSYWRCLDSSPTDIHKHPPLLDCNYNRNHVNYNTTVSKICTNHHWREAEQLFVTILHIFITHKMLKSFWNHVNGSLGLTWNLRNKDTGGSRSSCFLDLVVNSSSALICNLFLQWTSPFIVVVY